MLTDLRLAGMWEWPLLDASLVYGVMLSIHDVTTSTSAIETVLHLHVPFVLELALLSLAWYVSATLARVKLWLVPSVGFAIVSLLIPTNSFWVLVSLAPVSALLGVAISRFAGRDWALPLYVISLLAAIMIGYTGFTQGHLVATAWALLGFAALAYGIGILDDALPAMWIMPVFPTWLVIVAAGFLAAFIPPPLLRLAS